MKRKNLTVNLGNIKLTDSQYKNLLAAIHTTVNSKLEATTSKAKPKRKVSAAVRAATTVTAAVSLRITNTNPGNTQFKARHNGVTKTLTQTGSLSFNNVSKGDIISIQGRSLGTSEISIDVSASPQSKKFGPGTYNFNFFIL